MPNISPTQPQVVLVVDDDPGCLLGLSVCLELDGYQTVQAVTGEEALARYEERSGQVDFVITDLYLPGLNGMELIAELRWQGSTVPMLIVTAAVVDAATLIQQGASAVMRKPLDIAGLLTWLQREQSRGETCA